MGACRLECDPALTTCGSGGAFCADTRTDPHNCGACGMACSAGHTCTDSHCVLSCPAGQVACGALCTVLASDPSNCGLCSHGCGASEFCRDGACAGSCAPGQTVCAGACVATTSDPANCGACGTVCPARANALQVCAAGHCAMVCNAGYADCDGMAANGCEAATGNDPTSCGACGRACPGGTNARPACDSGRCTLACNPGFEDCDGMTANGCEADLRSSVSNCGACGNACPAVSHGSATCTAGSCGFACTAGWADCNGNASDGCEADLNGSANCGHCGNACPAGQPCYSGTCTPPLPSQCTSYVTVTDATRNIAYAGSSTCDSGLATNWYRLMGAAGTMMPTTPPPYSRCGTDAPGWLNGAHPTVPGDNVARTVCFNWSGNTCMWSRSIQVTNCNGFYVYQWGPSPVCNLRYCGT